MKKSYNLIKQIYKTHHLTPIRLVTIGTIIVCFCSILFIGLNLDHEYGKGLIISCKSIKYKGNNVTQNYFNRRQNSTLSQLGKVLFQNAPTPAARERNFTILIWKEGISLERRHIYYYSNLKHNPFEGCSVNNCNITYESDDLETSDAVVFSLQKFEGLDYLPANKTRAKNQRWIFLTDQSPFNTFRFREKNDWRAYNNIFNWSMSYKMESDVPVPYGRTISSTSKTQCEEAPIEEVLKLIPNFNEKRRDILLAIKTSECGQQKKRVRYLEELKNYIDVDIFGRCANDSKKMCSKMSDSDCSALNYYMFYLSFESSNCEQFITEELFWTAYSKGAVPIIMGPSAQNAEILLPPTSYIHADNFPDPRLLAEHLLRLNGTLNEEYLNYHKWRRSFEIVNEHGYFGSPSIHYCRICEALNYNDESVKSYEDLAEYLSVKRNCMGHNPS